LPVSTTLELSKEEWHQLSEEKFNTLFAGSPLKRTGYKGIKRNLTFLLS
jgi:epoxyqueuosine reductase